MDKICNNAQCLLLNSISHLSITNIANYYKVCKVTIDMYALNARNEC